MGNGPIRLLFLGQEPLDPESLVRRHGEEESTARTAMAEKEPVVLWKTDSVPTLTKEIPSAKWSLLAVH